MSTRERTQEGRISPARVALSRCRSVLTALGIALLSMVMSGAVFAFGPFPPGTTTFVDSLNTSGIESGTQSQPFNTIQEGIDAAPAGTIVGVAAGVYSGIQNENLLISKPLQLLGSGAKTTVIQEQLVGNPGFASTIIIDSPDVRVAGFTIQGVMDDESADAGIEVFPAGSDASVYIEGMVLTGNCFGMVENFGVTEGPSTTVIDRSVVVGNVCAGLYRPLQVTNSVIAYNGLPESNYVGYGIGAYPMGAPLFVNNTIVGNLRQGIVLPPTGEPTAPIATVIANNIVAYNGELGVAVGGKGWQFLQPPLGVNNLFYSNGGGNWDYELVDGSHILANTTAELNALPGHTGNKVADPKLADTSVGDFHLEGGSAAIDAGDGYFAPTVDLAGAVRPADGNGDCTADADIGAYEAAARVRRYPCQRAVFDPSQWILAGCEFVNCCPECFGEVLDLQIGVAVHPVKEFVLLFAGLDAAVANRVRIQGAARWVADDALLVTGNKVTLRGLPFPHSRGRDAFKMTVESFADDRPLVGALKVAVSQSVAGRTIATSTLQYPSTIAHGG